MCLYWVFSNAERIQSYHPSSRRSFVSMNITVRESEPNVSITPSHLQRENYKEDEMFFPSSVETTTTKKSKIGVRIQEETIRCLDRSNLQTYPRRNRAETAEVIIPSAEAKPSSTGQLSTFCNELYFPIAHRKGVRSYIKHYLSNFSSHNSLSPSDRAFALTISSVSIPENEGKLL